MRIMGKKKELVKSALRLLKLEIKAEKARRRAYRLHLAHTPEHASEMVTAVQRYMEAKAHAQLCEAMHMRLWREFKRNVE